MLGLSTYLSWGPTTLICLKIILSFKLLRAAPELAWVRELEIMKCLILFVTLTMAALTGLLFSYLTFILVTLT